jgi:PAS domain S-box-containing protein
MLLNGLAFGGLAVVLMIARIRLGEGLFIDARNVPVALIALFEGWPAGALAVLPPLAYRVWAGGAGLSGGVFGLLAAALLGGLAHAWARRSGGLRALHPLALSGAVFGTTALSFVLVGPYAVGLFGRIWWPLLLTYLVGISLFAGLMHGVQQRERLLAERERFRAILDEASDAIHIVDVPTNRILEVNRRDGELSGYAREEVIGRDARDFWPTEPEPRARLEAVAREALATGFVRAYGIPYRARTGRIISVDHTSRVVEHGGHRYVIVMFHEAAEREAAEAARREAAELKAVTLLAGAAAHEINNPLAVILGALDLLSGRAPADDLERKWIDQARGGIERIRDIVARMTRVTTVEARPAARGVPPILDLRKSSEDTP